MHYYLCLVGEFQGGGEESIIEDCLTRNIYQYHECTAQKGAGACIKEGDTVILVYKKEICAYGIASGTMGSVTGIDENWLGLPLNGPWIVASPHVGLPYGVFWHMLKGTKQSVVKEIDSAWANELLLRIIMNNGRKKLPKESVIQMHLETISSFLKLGFLRIPAVQRGKVWNAVRAEVLWDSLMRKIPVGSLSVRPVECGNESFWDLLDGQQRANAISLGHKDFPNIQSSDDQKKENVLWLDLGTQSAKTEQKDSKTKPSERRFFFMVTTVAHPWGYNLSDNETRNSCLKEWEKRDAVEKIGGNWEMHGKKGQKPYPYELWPYNAKFPVPFNIIRRFVEQNGVDVSFNSFLDFCKRDFSSYNWFARFKSKEGSDTNDVTYDLPQIDMEYWKEIVTATDKLSDFVIIAQNAYDIQDDDVGLYFARMNKAGIVPDDEEIKYSLLKSKVPSLKKLDVLAEGLMRPSRLANIAMLFYITKKELKWANQVNVKDIQELTKEQYFESFVENKLGNLLKKVETILVFDKNNNQCGLPKVNFSMIARNNPELFRICLYFADTDSGFEINNKDFISFVTIVSLFNVNMIFSDGYSIYQENKGDWNTATRKWLYSSVKNKRVLIPPTCDTYEEIYKATLSKDYRNVECAWNNASFADGINRTWYWNTFAGRFLLLYSVRKYLQNNFTDYDPSDAVWSEENTPWDYDHIFPQNWLISGKGNRQGSYHNLVREFLHSIGNSAPISFSRNRGKSNCPPGKYMDKENNSLLVEYEDFFEKDNKPCLEHDAERAFAFARITSKRLWKLYEEFYRSLNIDSLFNFSKLEDNRRCLFEKMRERFPNSKFYYTLENTGKQCEISAAVDWARPWLACGCIGKITVNDKQYPCLICIASDGNRIEIGLRRDPNDNSILGNNGKWWFDGHYKDLPFNEDFESLFAEYQELLKPC